MTGQDGSRTEKSVRFVDRAFDADVVYYLGANAVQADAAYYLAHAPGDSPNVYVGLCDSADDAAVVLDTPTGPFASFDLSVFIADSVGRAKRSLCFTQRWIDAHRTFAFVGGPVDGAINVHVADPSLRSDPRRLVVLLDALGLVP